MHIALIKPDLPSFEGVEGPFREILSSGKITNFGKYVDQFERDAAARRTCRHSVLGDDGNDNDFTSARIAERTESYTTELHVHGDGAVRAVCGQMKRFVRCLGCSEDLIRFLSIRDQQPSDAYKVNERNSGRSGNYMPI